MGHGGVRWSTGCGVLVVTTGMWCGHNWYTLNTYINKDTPHKVGVSIPCYLF